METKKTTAEEFGRSVARLREKALVQLEESGYHLRGKNMADVAKLLKQSAAAMMKTRKPND